MQHEQFVKIGWVERGVRKIASGVWLRIEEYNCDALLVGDEYIMFHNTDFVHRMVIAEYNGNYPSPVASVAYQVFMLGLLLKRGIELLPGVQRNPLYRIRAAHMILDGWLKNDDFHDNFIPQEAPDESFGQMLTYFPVLNEQVRNHVPPEWQEKMHYYQEFTFAQTIEEMAHLSVDDDTIAKFLFSIAALESNG